MKLILIIASITCFSIGHAQKAEIYNTEQEAVLHVVDLFFKSMAENDSALAKQIMTADGRYYATSPQAEGNAVSSHSHQEHFDRLGTSNDVVQERIWAPTVLIRHTIAMVWAPYDIYVNGDFLHCGIDCFTLVKNDDGWKIAGITFTMEPEDCDPSPLGPIKKK